jgi:hypothetical protein
MKNGTLIALACSLVVNVGLLYASQDWKGETKKLKQAALEEYHYAKTEAQKKYFLKPEYGLKFYDDKMSFELSIENDFNSDVKSPQLPSYSGDGLSVVGSVYTNDFDYHRHGLLGQDEMAVSQRILLLFCLQIIEQGNFYYGDFVPCGDKAAVAHLLHPAGVLTLAVAENRENEYYVSNAMYIHSGVLQNCHMGGPDFFKLPRSDFSFFTPTYIEDLRAKRAARNRYDRE